MLEILEMRRKSLDQRYGYKRLTGQTIFLKLHLTIIKYFDKIVGNNLRNLGNFGNEMISIRLGNIFT